MAVSDIQTIKGRIKSATPDSPIAVFTRPGGNLLAVFGSTVVTQAWIRESTLDFVGMFHGDMPEHEIHNRLAAAALGAK